MSSVYLQGLGRSGALSPLPSQEGSECLSGSSLTKAAICFSYVYCFYIWVQDGIYTISWHLFDAYRCLCIFNVLGVLKNKKGKIQNSCSKKNNNNCMGFQGPSKMHIKCTNHLVLK